tara:strand:- start:443 stop:568 length:126 start_codon:yes stop_codon:yes gene_type:complete
MMAKSSYTFFKQDLKMGVGGAGGVYDEIALSYTSKPLKHKG